MNGQFTYRKKDKTAKGHKIEKRVTLFEGENAYSILSEAYSKFDHIGVEFITVRTIQKIVQQNHKPFQQIPLDRQQMFHKVVIESHGGHLKTIKLDDLMDGFPISPQVLRSL